MLRAALLLERVGIRTKKVGFEGWISDGEDLL